MTKKIGFFVGSLRKDSYNKKIALNLVNMLSEIDKDYEGKIIEIGNLELFNQDFDDENQVPDSWQKFRDRVGTLDGAIFITPEYNRSVSGVLKNAIDVASRPNQQSKWFGLPAAIISSSIGGLSGFGAYQSLRPVLAVLNMPTMPQPEVYLGKIQEQFDQNGKFNNQSIKGFMTTFINSFIKWQKNNAR